MCITHFKNIFFLKTKTIVLQHHVLLPGPVAGLLPVAASARRLLLPAAAEPAGAPAVR